MDVDASADIAARAADVFTWVADLGCYPAWHAIVVRAEPASPAEGDPGPAWSVDLRASVGPLARSKRLRMVRTEHDPPHRVQFARRELDGRRHAPWVLDAGVEAVSDTSSQLTMRLHYGGTRWIPLVDRVLRDEIERSRRRLVEMLATRA